MAFREVATLDAEQTVALGGVNRKTGKKNLTTVEGYYLGTRQVESKKSKSGQAAIHFLKTAKGNLGVWGKTDMDRKLSSAPVGAMIRISFDKMVPTPNGEMYKYKVEVDADNVDDSIEASYTPGSADDVTSTSYASKVADSGYAALSAEDGDENEDDEGNSSYEAEEAAQAQALSAAERKAKVQQLLKSKR